jgi:N-acetylglucosaminyl-diphospho-decaprenol L-rhamnosyltransferase
MIDLDIVIVNWNTGARLLECLQAIPPASPQSDLYLRLCVVVDNASQDGSADGLAGLPLTLTLIRNTGNKGFAFAANQGAKVGQSAYILFLNPDTRLNPDSLVKALGFLDKPGNQQVAILGIQLADENGAVHRNVARFPTPKSMFYQMLGLDHLWPRHFPSHFLTDWDHQESRGVDQVTGAFFLVRRQVFEELQGFDERFFMYYEDLDFSYRATQAGWSSYYLAEAQAFHYGGGSSYQIKSKRLYYAFNSRVLYTAKHFGAPSAIKILVACFLVEFWARLAWSIANFSMEAVSETIQTYRMFLGTLPQLLRKLR